LDEYTTPDNSIELSELMPGVDNKVRIYCVTLSECMGDSVVQRCLSVLSNSEKEKSCRYRFQRDRQRYILTRALIRFLASEILDGPPEGWEFKISSKGKPRLISNDFQFNISHTTDYITCVIVKSGLIGIDIEKRPKDASLHRLAAEFFAKEETEKVISSTNLRQSKRFLSYWTLKEAYLKARGIGIGDSLNSFWFELDEGITIKLNAKTPFHNGFLDWNFRLFNLDATHVGALAASPDISLNSVCFYMVVPFLRLLEERIELCSNFDQLSTVSQTG